jgi:hypothetical protein
MSEISYVNRLGDALDAAIAATPAHTRGRLRFRRPGRRWRAALVVVVLAGGGVATASALLQPPSATTQAASGITCYSATSLGGGDMYADVEANGRSPLEACRDTFAADGPASLGTAGAALVACVKSGLGVVVLEGDGDPNQCSKQGMFAFQASSYAGAQTSVDTLLRALTALGANRTCIPAATLVAEVQLTLTKLGWRGWHAARQVSPAGTSSGTCGLFEGTGASFSDPTASVDANAQTVWIVTGPDPTVLALTGPLDLRLMQATGARCYATAEARTLVRGALASAHVTVAFDVTQEPSGEQSGYAQTNYDQGCTIVGSIDAAPIGRTVDALLYSQSGPPASAVSGPSPADFH